MRVLLSGICNTDIEITRGCAGLTEPSVMNLWVLSKMLLTATWSVKEWSVKLTPAAVNVNFAVRAIRATAPNGPCSECRPRWSPRGIPPARLMNLLPVPERIADEHAVFAEAPRRSLRNHGAHPVLQIRMWL